MEFQLVKSEKNVKITLESDSQSALFETFVYKTELSIDLKSTISRDAVLSHESLSMGREPVLKTFARDRITILQNSVAQFFLFDALEEETKQRFLFSLPTLHVPHTWFSHERVFIVQNFLLYRHMIEEDINLLIFSLISLAFKN